MEFITIIIILYIVFIIINEHYEPFIDIITTEKHYTIILWYNSHNCDNYNKEIVRKNLQLIKFRV